MKSPGYEAWCLESNGGIGVTRILGYQEEKQEEKWRWARDSNPGTAINRRRFSRPLHSATLPAHRLVEASGNASASCLVDSGRNDTGFAPSVNALQEKQSKFRGFWSELRQDYRVLMESIWCFSVVND
jgi:hypothetical protein